MYLSHKAIGIFGGTFDPIHLGHLRLAIELYEALGLAKVHVVPCYQPVHRKLPVATPEQRFAMLQCAVADEKSLLADDREIKRKGPSYMIDTVLSFREEMPKTPLCLLLGIDSFLGFTSWHRWEEILQHTHIIIAHRPQYQLPTTGVIADLIKDRTQQHLSYIHENLSGAIMLRPITPLEISASDIRRQIGMNKNPRYLLADKVYDYIKSHDIYRI